MRGKLSDWIDNLIRSYHSKSPVATYLSKHFRRRLSLRTYTLYAEVGNYASAENLLNSQIFFIVGRHFILCSPIVLLTIILCCFRYCVSEFPISWRSSRTWGLAEDCPFHRMRGLFLPATKEMTLKFFRLLSSVINHLTVRTLSLHRIFY